VVLRGGRSHGRRALRVTRAECEHLVGGCECMVREVGVANDSPIHSINDVTRVRWDVRGCREVETWVDRWMPEFVVAPAGCECE
jgi:hypothetical protein